MLKILQSPPFYVQSPKVFTMSNKFPYVGCPITDTITLYSSSNIVENLYIPYINCFLSLYPMRIQVPWRQGSLLGLVCLLIHPKYLSAWDTVGALWIFGSWINVFIIIHLHVCESFLGNILTSKISGSNMHAFKISINTTKLYSKKKGPIDTSNINAWESLLPHLGC